MSYLIAPKYEDAPIRYFQDLTQIPRPSGSEGKVSDFLLAFADAHGLFARRDEENNVFIKKDGVGNGKNASPVILQGHVDMVTEKNSDTVFDFENDPLKLQFDGTWLTAEGTTLGADNGVAVAYMLSALANTELPLPPLECIFTTDEERGLTGAAYFDMSDLEGTVLINLDGEGDGVFVASCAGGARVDLTVKCDYSGASGTGLQLNVSGLHGGHSGVEITDELGNANKILARLLDATRKVTEVRIASLGGGMKDNAIPRESTCVFTVADNALAKEAIVAIAEEIKSEYQATDSGLTIDIVDVNVDKAFLNDDSEKLIDMMSVLPNGPRHRDKELEDFIINSSNLGVVTTNESGEVKMVISCRSSVGSLKEEILNEIRILARLFGAEIGIRGEYPGWRFAKESRVRDLAAKVYEERTGKKASIEATHGGLECGLLIEKKPELDAVSFGPHMEAIHTPDERLHVESFENTYDFLIALLLALAA